MALICAEIDRTVVVVSGPDAGRYLHSQLSNDITSMTIGDSRYSFVLEPNGKANALVRVSRIDQESFLLDTEPLSEIGRVIIDRLARFKIRVDVDMTWDVRQGCAVRVTHPGESLVAVIDSLALLDQAVVVPAWWNDGRAVDVLPLIAQGRIDIDHVAADSGATRVHATRIDDERVAAGWPGMGSEIVPGETLPAATGLTGCAVSFTKGCYPGQELVERMDSRGTSAPRTLRRVATSDVPMRANQMPTVGADVVVEGEVVGTITSVTQEWTLAYVARAIAIGDVVTSPT